MYKIIIAIIFVVLSTGCVKERNIGQYISTTFPCINVSDGEGSGFISLRSNRGDENSGFDIECSLKKINQNEFFLHANVTPNFRPEGYKSVSFYLVLLDNGKIVRNIRVPAHVNVGNTTININKNFQNDEYFDSMTFFYEMRFIY